MPTIEWVSLNVAVERLRSLWGIPPLIAEDIVRNVIQGGKVDVRAVTLGRLVPQIITEQIRSELVPNALFAVNYENIEIDWNGLLVHGRKLIPTWIHVPEPPTERRSSHKRDRTVPSPSPAAKIKLKNSRRGPKQGTTGLQTSDRNLFPRITEQIQSGKARSPYGAALNLMAEIAGNGTPKNKAKRVSALYRREQAAVKPLKLSETV